MEKGEFTVLGIAAMLTHQNAKFIIHIKIDDGWHHAANLQGCTKQELDRIISQFSKMVNVCAPDAVDEYIQEREDQRKN